MTTHDAGRAADGPLERPGPPQYADLAERPGPSAAGSPRQADTPGTRRGSGRLLTTAFLRNPRTLVGLAMVAVVVAFCFIGPLLYRTDQQRR